MSVNVVSERRPLWTSVLSGPGLTSPCAVTPPNPESMCLCYTDMLWSKASIPPPRCSWRAERLQWVCPCMRVERQRNVCLVGSIDIFPWAQEKATGNKGKQGFCRFMCLHVCVCLRVCEYVCELQYLVIR